MIFFSIPTKVVSVSGIDLQVYEFDTKTYVEKSKEIVSSDGTEIGSNIIRWINVPHFYSQDKIIVQYIGHNPEILNLHDSLLGNQFAGLIRHSILFLISSFLQSKNSGKQNNHKSYNSGH